MKKHAWY
ncbi:rCG49909 [Rattus norvegicus]|nr:rCG49909 [Rattus norvegicus]